MQEKYSDREPFLNKIYSKINSGRKKYGQLKKCEIHIHTPESACYRFITSNSRGEDNLEGKYLYSKLTTEEVLNYSKNVGYLSENMYDEIMKKYDYYDSDQHINDMKSKNIPYDSLKEYVTYMTIAYKLYKEDIKVAVVSDHNTVSGYEKLKYAIKKYCNDNYKDKRNLIRLFLGVEVSCSDKNHLMIIYDERKIKN